MNIIRALFILFIWLFSFFSCIRIQWLRNKEIDLRETILSVSVLWGVLVWGITEILNLFSQLTFIGIVLLWVVSLVGIVIIGMKSGKLSFREIYSVSDFIPRIFSFKSSKTLIFLSPYFLIMFIILGFIAFVSAPNTWDSMSYHLSRVIHWQRNQSLRFYPTHNLRQLYSGPWVEMAILHLQVLVGSDRLANFVQYFAMIGNVIGVSYITKLLGGGLKAQIFSAIMVITLPMGILQSTSTQNDYVVGFWLVCLVSFTLILLNTRPHLSLSLLIGGSSGLALLTKSTTSIYILPFVFWFGYVLLMKHKTNFFKPASVIVVIILLINGSHFIRNYSLCGNIFGPEEQCYRNDIITVSTTASNLVRNVGLHLGTPIVSLNKFFQKNIYQFHSKLGIDIEDPRTGWGGSKFAVVYSKHEDNAGNPLHLILFLVSILFLPFFRDTRSVKSVAYTFCIVVSFFIFCFYLKWQPWHSRLHLPLFILAMPISGLVLSRFSRYGIPYLLMIFLIAYSIPYVINNKSRSLIGKNSILLKDRISQYFINRPHLESPYKQVMELCSVHNCNQIGLISNLDDWDYPFWILGNLLPSGGRVEHIAVTNVSRKLISNFEPDAIIITYPNQEKEKSFQGKSYPKVFESDRVNLFIITNKLTQKP